MGKYDLTGICGHQEAQQEAAAPIDEPAKPVLPSAPATREPGKRSRSDFTRTTIYLREETKLRAVRLLENRKDKRDLSDLIEGPVAAWVSKHTNV
jgi:hypothetical protein